VTYTVMNKQDQAILLRAKAKPAAERTEEETEVIRRYWRLQQQRHRAGLSGARSDEGDVRVNLKYREWLEEQGHDPDGPYSYKLYSRWRRYVAEEGDGDQQ